MMAKEYWVLDSGLDEEANQTAMFDTNVAITSKMSHLSDYIFASLLVFICEYLSFCTISDPNDVERPECLPMTWTI